MDLDACFSVHVDVDVHSRVSVPEHARIQYVARTRQEDGSIASRFGLITGRFLPQFMRAVRLNVRLRTRVVIVRAIRAISYVSPRVVEYQQVVALLRLTRVPTLNVIREERGISVFGRDRYDTSEGLVLRAVDPFVRTLLRGRVVLNVGQIHRLTNVLR